MVNIYHSKPSCSQACFKPNTLRMLIYNSNIRFIKPNCWREVCLIWKSTSGDSDMLPISGQCPYCFWLTSSSPSPSLSPTCRWFTIITSSSYLFPQFQLCVFNCLSPLQTACPTSIFNSNCSNWINFFQTCLSPSTHFHHYPSQKPGDHSISFRFHYLPHPIHPSVLFFFLPWLFSLLPILFSSHWYSHCLDFCLSYYYPVVTNYYASSSAFCNWSSIQLPE